MEITQEWKKYIESWEEVTYAKFYNYFKKYKTIEEAIKQLKIPRGNWKKGFTKVGNPQEVAEFAKINSPTKAARIYELSERQVYRYMEKYIKS